MHHRIWQQLTWILSLLLFADLNSIAQPVNGQCAQTTIETGIEFAATSRGALSRPYHTVILGTGHIVTGRENGYLAAAVRTAKERPSIFSLVDNSSYWNMPDPESHLSNLTQHGFNFYDLRPTNENESEYDVLGQTLKKLLPDTIFIATPDETHVRLAKEVLIRCPQVRRVIIEKPLSNSIEAAEDLEHFLIENNLEDRVYVVDHFRARFPKFSEPYFMQILQHLGGTISRAQVYYLEDGSGLPYDGPIENVGRVRTLSHGVAFLDLLPHALGLFQFADPDLKGLTLKSLSAGQYYGVYGSSRQRTEIAEETFGRIIYDFHGNVMNRNMDFTIKIYMGKNIKGHNIAGFSYVKNVKAIFLRGANPKKAVLMDLGSISVDHSVPASNAIHMLELSQDGKTWSLPEGHSVPLVQSPYHALVSMEVMGKNHGVMPFRAAMQMQRHLSEAIDKRNSQYPLVHGQRSYFAYPGGMSPNEEYPIGRDAATLTEVLRILHSTIMPNHK